MNTPLNKPSEPHWNGLTPFKSNAGELPQNFLAPKIEAYYRSKAFISQNGLNPLVDASAPLLFLVETLENTYKTPDIDKLHDDLVHELKAFEVQAKIQNYPHYVILAAKYVLSSWIDQVILNKPWGVNSQWQSIQSSDYMELYPANWADNNLFAWLLHRCLQEPSVYIDVLELFYICLNLGFTPALFPAQEIHEFNTLNAAKDSLFEAIQKQRALSNKKLEIDKSAPPLLEHTPRRSYRWLLRSALVIGSILVIGITYIVLNHALEVSLFGLHAMHAS